jgi:hypothetical protein
MKSTNAHLVKAVAAMTAISFLSACSGSFETPTNIAGSGSNGSSSVGGLTDQAAAFNKIDMTGLVASPNQASTNGSLAVTIDKVNQTLLLSIPMTLPILSATVNINLPQYPDIQIYTSVDNNFTTHLTASIPLKYIVKGVTFGNPAKLPNGQALPYFADGEAPSTAFVIDAVKNVKLNLYMSSSGIGLFVSNPQIPTYFGFTYPIKNVDQTKIIGAFSLVQKTSMGDGGFYVATRIPDEIAKIIDDYIGNL